VGVCYYKLGCVALDRNRVEEAADHLRHALTIAKLQAKFSPGHVARTKYKLAQALRRLPGEYQFEADEHAVKAEELWRDIINNGSVKRGSPASIVENPASETLSPQGERDYDDLIANFWR
jgi:hypothetical protein